MNDREMLEFAAKAAGMNTPRYVIEGRQLGWAINEGVSVESGPTSQRLWNPLTYDGDALRLAVVLRITPHIDSNLTEAEWAGRGCGGFILEPHNNDPAAATRRAIVRAAAEIGRAMK